MDCLIEIKGGKGYKILNEYVTIEDLITKFNPKNTMFIIGVDEYISILVKPKYKGFKIIDKFYRICNLKGNFKITKELKKYYHFFIYDNSYDEIKKGYYLRQFYEKIDVDDDFINILLYDFTGNIEINPSKRNFIYSLEYNTINKFSGSDFLKDKLDITLDSKEHIYILYNEMLIPKNNIDKKDLKYCFINGFNYEITNSNEFIKKKGLKSLYDDEFFIFSK